MGMYTEIRTNFTLRPDAPESVVKTLMVMSGSDPDVSFRDREHYDHGQTHALFKCDRWDIMLTMESAYFDDKPSVAYHRDEKGLHFQSVSNFKNYSGEIFKFADWIRPYVQPQEKPFVTSAYEEFQDQLTRYYTDGRVELDKPKPYNPYAPNYGGW